jgi:hypothetical protein
VPGLQRARDLVAQQPGAGLEALAQPQRRHTRPERLQGLQHAAQAGHRRGDDEQPVGTGAVRQRRAQSAVACSEGGKRHLGQVARVGVLVACNSAACAASRAHSRVSWPAAAAAAASAVPQAPAPSTAIFIAVPS